MSADTTVEDRDHRREFMKRLAVVAASAAAVGAGAGAAEAQLRRGGGPAERESLLPPVLRPNQLNNLQGRDLVFARTFGKALQTLDAPGAVKELGESLSQQDKDLLMKLDARDLADLNFIVQKLGPGMQSDSVGGFIF